MMPLGLTPTGGHSIGRGRPIGAGEIVGLFVIGILGAGNGVARGVVFE